MILNLNCSWEPQVAASKSQVSRATSYPAFARYASAPGNFLVGNSRRKEVISRPSASVHPSGRSFPASQLSGAAEEEKRPRRTLIDKKHDEIRAFVDTASILGDIAQHGTRDVLTDLFYLPRVSLHEPASPCPITLHFDCLDTATCGGRKSMSGSGLEQREGEEEDKKICNRLDAPTA